MLITGMGPVGMAAGLVAKKMGATLVIGADVSQTRLDFAVQCGRDRPRRARRPPGCAQGQIKALTGGYGCEVSVDCSARRRGACWRSRAPAAGAAAPWSAKATRSTST